MKEVFWNRFAGIYDLFMSKDRKAYKIIVDRMIPHIYQKKVLEVATGTGLIARELAPYTDSMVAVDYAEGMINQAKRKCQDPHLTFMVADALNLPFEDQSFDVVIISNTLHIISDPEKTLKEIHRVLKDDGLLIAPTFTHAVMSSTQKLLSRTMCKVSGFYVESLWDEAEYKAFVESNGFKVSICETLKASFPLTYLEAKKAGSL